MSMAVREYLEGMEDVTYSAIAEILSLFSRIILSYTFADVFGNMAIAFAEAFSWGLLLVLFLV